MLTPFQRKLLDYLKRWTQGLPLRRARGYEPGKERSWWRCGSRSIRLNEADVQALIAEGKASVDQGGYLRLTQDSN